MSAAHLYIFDDRIARRWAPFTLTRPVGELLYGCMRIRERAERIFGLTCEGYVSRPALLGFDEPGSGKTLTLVEIADEGERILLSSRATLHYQDLPPLEGPARLRVGDNIVGWIIPEGMPLPSELSIHDPHKEPWRHAELELEGHVLDRPWHLMADNADQVKRDLTHWWPEDSQPDGVIRIGDGVLSMAPGSVIESGVVVDTRGGPIRLDPDAYVRGPARLTGPLFVGSDTVILGGDVGTSSIGPHCKIRGEVSDSVILGFTNKAHGGHLGHAILGSWVNLGAETSNSDLKNNYGPVKVWTPDGTRDTGFAKGGCFLGDHVKTGIGTLFNTGTVVGAGSNVFGGGTPPTVVPPFSWGTAADLRDYRMDRFLETAERSMARRGQSLTDGVRRILQDAWSDTAGRRAE
jgi:UDP-N-acetylglucosamine diphosphorylase/glucosamine-1-phosphate N-acetyltransferase